MAEQIDSGSGNGVPPAGEQVHMPGASYLPALTALGVTLVVTGVVINWVMFGIGVAITLVALIRWIKETREDIAQLPLEH
jgi:hypothetical protein